MITIDELIFFRGVQTTNQMFFLGELMSQVSQVPSPVSGFSPQHGQGGHSLDCCWAGRCRSSGCLWQIWVVSPHETQLQGSLLGASAIARSLTYSNIYNILNFLGAVFPDRTYLYQHNILNFLAGMFPQWCGIPNKDHIPRWKKHHGVCWARTWVRYLVNSTRRHRDLPEKGWFQKWHVSRNLGMLWKSSNQFFWRRRIISRNDVCFAGQRGQMHDQFQTTQD